MNHIDKPYPLELETLIQGAIYTPETWRVRAGGGVRRNYCRAQIAHPIARAVSNQCSRKITKWFGRFGFCTQHGNDLFKRYKITVTLAEQADDSFFVKY